MTPIIRFYQNNCSFIREIFDFEIGGFKNIVERKRLIK
jgi:hypothetical protein